MILPPFVAIPWALAKRVPLWIYAAIAVVLLVLWYGSGRYDAGVAHERAAQAKAQEIAITAVKKQREVIEARDREDFAKIGAKLDKENARASAEKDRLIAGLRNGSIRVHSRFKCPAQPRLLPETAGSPSGRDGADDAGFNEADAEVAFGITDTGDLGIRRLTACQAILKAERD